MGRTYKIYITVLFISVLFSCSSGKDADSAGKGLGVRKSDILEDRVSGDKKVGEGGDGSSSLDKELLWKYYRGWDDKKDILYDIIGDSDTIPKVYYKAGYRSGKPVLIIGYKDNKESLRLKFVYGGGGKLRRKILFKKSKTLGKIEVLSELSPLGYKEMETIYRSSGNISDRRRRGSKLVQKEFAQDTSLSKLTVYDEEERIKEQSIFEYDTGKRLVSKTVYSRDIKLMGSLDYYRDLYKDYTEYYKKSGLIYKKEWYYKEEGPGSLYFTDKYIYLSSGNTLVKSYDRNGKLIHKKEFNKRGDVIKSEFFD